MVKRSTRKCTLALVSACLTVRSDCAVGIFCRVPSVYYLIIISGIGGRCLKLASVSYLAPPVNAAWQRPVPTTLVRGTLVIEFVHWVSMTQLMVMGWSKLRCLHTWPSAWTLPTCRLRRGADNSVVNSKRKKGPTGVKTPSRIAMRSNGPQEQVATYDNIPGSTKSNKMYSYRPKSIFWGVLDTLRDLSGYRRSRPFFVDPPSRINHPTRKISW